MKSMKNALYLFALFVFFGCNQEEFITAFDYIDEDITCAQNWAQMGKRLGPDSLGCKSTVRSSNWMEADGLQVEQEVHPKGMGQLAHVFFPLGGLDSIFDLQVYLIPPTEPRKSGTRFKLSLELGNIELPNNCGMVIGMDSLVHIETPVQRKIIQGSGDLVNHAKAAILLKKEFGVYYLGFDSGHEFIWIDQPISEVSGGIFSIEFMDTEAVLSASLRDADGLVVIEEDFTFNKPAGDQFGFVINARGLPEYQHLCLTHWIRYRLLDFQYGGTGTMDDDTFDCDTIY
jgi:hypothetical protein